MSHWSDEQTDGFLATLASTGNVALACRAVGVSRSGAYVKRDIDEAFDARWIDAIADAADALHEEARRRAVDGVEEPILYKGRVVESVTKYSDSLLHALLKAHNPLFRDRVGLEHSGPDGEALPAAPSIDVSIYTDEELVLMRRLAHRALEAPKPEPAEVTSGV